MEYAQIKKILEDVENSKLAEVSIEFPDGLKINMKKNLVYNQEKTILPTSISNNQIVKVEENNEKKDESENYKIVKSPMVGTFYSKPSPEENSYVHIGQNVKKGEVLCVIEAMKLINEIESDFDGKIEEILVKDGEKVDFGKPLFKLS